MSTDYSSLWDPSRDSHTRDADHRPTYLPAIKVGFGASTKIGIE